jgi:hypothetical protein
MAWAEGRSRKHETDIFEMMVFQHLEATRAQSPSFEESYVDTQARALGEDVVEFWRMIKEAARREAKRAE